MIELLVWNNQGEKEVKRLESLRAAEVHAKMARTLKNRTVKIADAGGLTYHWKRSTHLSRNHWTACAVDGDFLTN